VILFPARKVRGPNHARRGRTFGGAVQLRRARSLSWAGSSAADVRTIVNDALAALAGDFSALYSRMGRPSIPPEKLLRAMLLQAFYSIRSERQLMERLEFDLLFRWFVGIGVDDAVWDHSTFSKNRDRLLEGDIAAKLLRAGD
jgi:transposase